MSQDTSLSELVLGYCRQVGALVEPPAYGVSETLLPDEVAARWGVAPIQRFVFEPANQGQNTTYLHYGHALVETIVDELRGQRADGQFFINNVRPEKPALFAAIEKTFSLSNAKIFPIPMAKEQARLHHYVRFNFKVSLIADEKRELILPMWMDLQNGYPVPGADIERLGILDLDNDYAQTPPAAASWIEGHPLSPNVLAGLLERARQSVTGELGDTLSHLQKRLARFLELDRARLNDYYADLLKDAERRLKKADGLTADRHSALESKIAAIVAERESKLADVEQKYRLRVQLELVSLAVIALPKLDLTVEIRKRTSTVKRTVSWNPLLHAVDPLACDVCNHSGTTLHLCDNGHLAHTDCLAPQCVECKRTFCQKCAHEVATCAVCDRPICVHSLTRCAECKRVTCGDHAGECHALDGGPRRIVITEKKAGATESRAGSKEASHETETTPKEKKVVKRESSKARIVPKKFSEPPKPLADYVEVYADPSEGTITAYMIRRQRELAARWWTMTDEGIAVNCQCEKTWQCESNGMVYRPSDHLERQLDYLLGLFREEYHLPDKKTRYFQVRLGKPFDEKKLKIPASWRDEATLERARQGFERLRKKRS
jgi:hypothetical protein